MGTIDRVHPITGHTNPNPNPSPNADINPITGHNGQGTLDVMVHYEEAVETVFIAPEVTLIYACM